MCVCVCVCVYCVYVCVCVCVCVGVCVWVCVCGCVGVCVEFGMEAARKYSLERPRKRKEKTGRHVTRGSCVNGRRVELNCHSRFGNRWAEPSLSGVKLEINI